MRSITNRPVRLQLSQIIAALSYALDMTEGQPEGHAARSCMIGMRLAREMGLPRGHWSSLFYALLLKDLGCSSNASKVCYLFGADDLAAKNDLKTTDWSRLSESLKYIARNAAPNSSGLQRARQLLSAAVRGPAAARGLVQLRCDRGATIARNLQLPEATALAIRSLDEHWDGHGYPDSLRGEQIPLLARILNLSQTLEVFWAGHGLQAASDVARERRGAWFDPQLVDAMAPIFKDEEFWANLGAEDAAAQVASLEPQDQVIVADDATLDRIAHGFGQVIDAKSPWTYCHSAGVATIALGIGSVLGFSAEEQRQLGRAALLHDIGKLGVSNLILDKPGKLTSDELVIMRKHPALTYEVLLRVDGFSQFAELAASHHERLDGRGYHRGLPGELLPPAVRTLVVADMYEALAAKRPYRQDLDDGQVMNILDKDAGIGICPEVLAALKTFLAASNFVPYRIAA